jgi:hypothetical protein
VGGELHELVNSFTPSTRKVACTRIGDVATPETSAETRSESLEIDSSSSFANNHDSQPIGPDTPLELAEHTRDASERSGDGSDSGVMPFLIEVRNGPCTLPGSGKSNSLDDLKSSGTNAVAVAQCLLVHPEPVLDDLQGVNQVKHTEILREVSGCREPIADILKSDVSSVNAGCDCRVQHDAGLDPPISKVAALDIQNDIRLFVDRDQSPPPRIEWNNQEYAVLPSTVQEGLIPPGHVEHLAEIESRPGEIAPSETKEEQNRKSLNLSEPLYVDEFGSNPEDQYNTAASVPFFNGCSATLGFTSARLLQHRLSGIVSLSSKRS